MNYRIVGNDGKTYGPVTAEQLRVWIAQSRVESRTAVFVEGATEWTFLGLLPEFAGYFNTPPPVSGLGGTIRPDAGLPKRTNTLAIWSLVCGILAWVCCCCCIPFNLLGVIFAIIALVQISARPETQEGRTQAIIGLVLSVLNLFWCLGLSLFNLAANQANFTYIIH